MKIQLDTTEKTITIEESVNLHDFYEQINTLLPNGIWREFTLKVSVIKEWKNPINIPNISNPQPSNPQPYHPQSPFDNPYIPPIWYTTCGTDNFSLNDGIYNITT